MTAQVDLPIRIMPSRDVPRPIVATPLTQDEPSSLRFKPTGLVASLTCHTQRPSLSGLVQRHAAPVYAKRRAISPLSSPGQRTLPRQVSSRAAPSPRSPLLHDGSPPVPPLLVQPKQAATTSHVRVQSTRVLHSSRLSDIPMRIRTTRIEARPCASHDDSTSHAIPALSRLMRDYPCPDRTTPRASQYDSPRPCRVSSPQVTSAHCDESDQSANKSYRSDGSGLLPFNPSHIDGSVRVSHVSELRVSTTPFTAPRHTSTSQAPHQPHLDHATAHDRTARSASRQRARLSATEHFDNPCGGVGREQWRLATS